MDGRAPPACETRRVQRSLVSFAQLVGGAEPLFRSQPSPSRSLERPPMIPIPQGLKPRPHSQGSLGTGRQDGVMHTGRPRVFSTFFRETSPVLVYSRSAWGSVLGWYPLPIPGQGSLPIPERKLPTASEAAGCRAEAQQPVEEKPRRKGWEGERVARGRGNSRLR